MSRRVPLRADEMQRHVGTRSLDPAVMPRGDVEQVARPERECLAVVHDDAAPPRDDEPHVLDQTTLGPRDGADVRGPLPPRLVAGAPDGEVPDLHEIELPHLEAARLVGPVESSDDRVFHTESPCVTAGPASARHHVHREGRHHPTTMVSSTRFNTHSASQAANGLQSNPAAGGSTRRIGSTSQSVSAYAGRSQREYRK